MVGTCKCRRLAIGFLYVVCAVLDVDPGLNVDLVNAILLSYGCNVAQAQ